MRILITEVTEMHGSNYCVAGWNPAAHKMIRPLPNGRNWTAPLLAAHNVSPGATIRVRPTDEPTTGSFPHKTEDTYIHQSSVILVDAGPIHWFGPDGPPVAESLDDIFDGELQINSIWNNVRQGAHVPVGTVTSSLGAVRIRRSALSLVEDFGKLKGVMDDGIARYKLSITSHVLKEAWREGGLAGVNRLVPARRDLHVRVGLAREMAGKCYAMINGIYW